MIKTFRSRWTLSCSVGFALCYLSVILVGAISELMRPEAVDQAIAHLDGQFFQSVEELREAAGDEATYEIWYRYGLIMHLVMYPVFGVILGSAQALQLRKAIPRVWPWIGVSALGFVTIIGGELIQPHIIIGPFPGPVEPIMIALGGGGLAGLFQWLYLRKNNYPSAKWLGFWIGGLVLGIIVAFAVIVGYQVLFRDAVQYLETNMPNLALSLEIGILGGIVGVVAGWLSSRVLQASLGIPDNQEKPVTP